MADVIIFGTGQISEIVHFYIEKDTEHRVVGFTVDSNFLTEAIWKGRAVVPFETLGEYYTPEQVSLLLPISFKGVNRFRKDHYMDAKKRGYRFISYISSKATYYGTPVGENTIIMEDNTIQPFSSIGNNVILWSGNHVGHHSKIEDHVFVASHVVISGSVNIGEQTFVGVNAAIHDNVSVGRECVIGAGSIVSRNLADHSVLRPPSSKLAELKSFELKGF